MGYGGVREGDKRKDAAPQPRKKTDAIAAAGEEETADQESKFTGKRTYDSGRQDKDADEREKN